MARLNPLRLAHAPYSGKSCFGALLAPMLMCDIILSRSVIVPTSVVGQLSLLPNMAGCRKPSHIISHISAVSSSSSLFVDVLHALAKHMRAYLRVHREATEVWKRAVARPSVLAAPGREAKCDGQDTSASQKTFSPELVNGSGARPPASQCRAPD